MLTILTVVDLRVCVLCFLSNYCRLFYCDLRSFICINNFILSSSIICSVQTEEYVIPSNDLLPSRIVELKKIPKSASMVVGHNGYGEFSLWYEIFTE